MNGSLMYSRGEYLCASGMAQIICPVYFKPQMIVGMNHLMRHGILQMTLVLHLVRAH